MPKHPVPEPASDAPAVSMSACNSLALRQAARHVSQIYDRHMAASGLRGSQYSILSTLGRLGPQPIGKLAEILVLDRTALGRALGPLERDKLVIVGDGPDRRTRSIRLTPAGQTRLKEAAVHWRKAQKEFETKFGPDESQALRTTLRRVVQVVGQPSPEN